MFSCTLSDYLPPSLPVPCRPPAGPFPFLSQRCERLEAIRVEQERQVDQMAHEADAYGRSGAEARALVAKLEDTVEGLRRERYHCES